MALWRFWNRTSGNIQLSKGLQDELLSRFKVNPQETAKLRYAKESGHYAGRTVGFVCIFDPEKVPNATVVAQTYDGLCNQRVGVLFTGHIEKDGSIHLIDRRSAQSTAV